MAKTAKHQLVEDRLGQPLDAFIASRYKPYIRGFGWRVVAADIEQETGIVVSHETLRSWFADEPRDDAKGDAA